MRSDDSITVIIGASTNPARYAYMAAEKLQAANLEFIPVGIKQGVLFGKEILNLRDYPKIENVDTITLYMNPRNQEEWEDYILTLTPNRIIFNPGTENPSFMKKAEELAISIVPACTLTMLSLGHY